MARKQIAIGRRAFLLGLGSLAGAGAVSVGGGLSQLNNQILAIASQGRDFTVVGETPLRDRAAAKGLIYGAATVKRMLDSDPEYARRFAQECGILVPDWQLKWRTVHPTPKSFDFAAADWLAEFARAHQMLFRGHTLVWHEDLPPWFQEQVNSQNAKQILLKHITTLVKHYAGKIHSWDVVNEAILPDDHQVRGLRNTPWLKLLGPDYIEIAFRAAAEADPRALLVYNDHHLDYDRSDDERRRTAVLRLLERLKSRGVPIHALGMQAHLNAEETRFNSKKLRNFLQEIAGLGLKITITEMDVTDQKLPRDVGVRDRIIAGMYEDYLSVVLDEPATIAVLTWGLSDRYSWLTKYKPRDDRASVRPLPLDAQYRRKLAWKAMARAFDNAPVRS